jgi:hypothetical protein
MQSYESYFETDQNPSDVWLQARRLVIRIDFKRFGRRSVKAIDQDLVFSLVLCDEVREQIDLDKVYPTRGVITNNRKAHNGLLKTVP